MVSLEVLILSIAFVLLAVENGRIKSRLADMEAQVADLDGEVDYQFDYNNERWQAVNEAFDNTNALIHELASREDE
jgi:hypothetical protein